MNRAAYTAPPSMKGTEMTNTIMNEFTVHPRAAAPRYNNEGYNLCSVYDSWSFKKDKAWQYCMWLCNQVEGTGLAIR